MKVKLVRRLEVKSVLSEALNCIRRARGIKPTSEIEYSALRWEVYAALQNTLDAMSMIVADLGLKKPSAYSDLGRTLFDGGFLSKGEADYAERVAIVRNMLAHAYRRVSAEDLQAIVRRLLPKTEKLLIKLGRLVEEKRLDPVERCNPHVEELAGLEEVFKKHSVLLAYLLGSRARGTYSADSDYDIAVLFEDRGVGILEETNLTLDVARKLGVPSSMVNVVSLNSFDYPIIARVLREGILIYQKSAEYKKAWERKAYLQILQNTDLYAVYTKRILKRKGKRRRI